MSKCFIDEMERDSIINLINGMDLCDEDSVWDVGIALESFSILLRSRVLEKSGD